ncbi:MAG: hypothetical protein JWM33_3186, partial [Caulobacteraceae bacterium]|nr:hypothetical protein [Caulobacteraceae bacterium]
RSKMTPDLLNGAGGAILSAAALAAGGLAAQITGAVSCAWPAKPDELLNRLQAVKAARTAGKIRMWLGRLLLAGLLTGGAVVAYAAQPSGPDILPKEVVGVVGSGDQLNLQVMQDQGVRTLKPGDLYRDGWTVTAVTASTATLTKGGQSRMVGLNPDGALQQRATAAPSQVTLASGNIQDAIAAGDVARIMQLGGSPMDVINAERAILARDPGAMFEPGGAVSLSQWMASAEESQAARLVPVFVHEGNRNMLAQQYSDGHLDSFSSVPGMNQPGAALVGAEYHTKTPAEVLAEANARQAVFGLAAGGSADFAFGASPTGVWSFTVSPRYQW